MERPRAAQRIFFSAAEASKSAPRGFQDRSKRQPRSPDAPRRVKEASGDRFHPLWVPFGSLFWTILGPLLEQIVNASRIPPRPLAGQRLEDAGQQLEAWKTPQESSWRRLRASNLSPGELLESSWRLPEPSWRLLESLRGVLGALGAVLEAYWEVLGRS